MNTGILFDLDGTLLDTLDDLTDGVNYALHRFGCPSRTREEVRCFVGNGAERLIRLALPGKPEDPAANDVLEVFRAYYNAHCLDKTRPYPGILDALHQLPYPAAIVSNKPDSAVKPLCARFFPGIPAVGETAGCPRKPAPDMLFRAMKELCVQRCIYVGDSEVDIATAKNADVQCLSVLWGFRDRDSLILAGGSKFCDNPKALPAVLSEMERSYGK